MLTMVEAFTANGETLALPLDDISGGYVVEDIDGLDPVKANIISSSFANLDGTQYQSSRRENRNIILKLGIEPDYVTTSVRQLRSRLYNFFMPKTYVTLRFYMDGVRFVDISGRVESCSAPLFTDDPVVTISLLCFDPDFIATDSVKVTGATVADATEKTIPYPGSVETGVEFKLTVTRSISGFMIYSAGPGSGYQSFEFEGSLVAGDVLTISTVSGAKRATLTRSGVDSSILWGVSPASTWFNLYPGDNQFRVVVSGLAIPYTVEYKARYGGL